MEEAWGKPISVAKLWQDIAVWLERLLPRVKAKVIDCMDSTNIFLVEV